MSTLKFTPHTTDKCPVDPDTRVLVMFADLTTANRLAGQVYWKKPDNWSLPRWEESEAIVSYAIIQEARPLNDNVLQAILNQFRLPAVRRNSVQGR